MSEVHLHALFSAGDPRRLPTWRNLRPWIVHSNDVENEPDRVQRFETRFGPIENNDRGKKAQPKAAPFKISPELRTYFPECRNEQCNQNEQAN